MKQPFYRYWLLMTGMCTPLFALIFVPTVIGWLIRNTGLLATAYTLGLLGTVVFFAAVWWYKKKLNGKHQTMQDKYLRDMVQLHAAFGFGFGAVSILAALFTFVDTSWILGSGELLLLLVFYRMVRRVLKPRDTLLESINEHLRAHSNGSTGTQSGAE